MIHRYIKVKTGISLFVNLVVARVLQLNINYSEVRKSDKGANSFRIQLQFQSQGSYEFILDNIFILEK